VKAFRDRSVPGGDGTASRGTGTRRAFRQGAITNLLNPKVILFNVAFLPQFVDPSLGHVPGQLLLFGGALVVVGFLWDGCVGLLSGRLAGLLGRSARVNRWPNIVSGTVFTGLAVRLMVASPKQARGRAGTPERLSTIG
jgi:threonine/homoserine/homoserine lactone efflux protein